MSDKLTTTDDLFIDGKWQRGEGPALVSTSPDERETLWRGHSASARQVDSAVAAGREAQRAWAALGLPRRRAIVEDFAALLREDGAALAAAIAGETGKPLWEAETEVQAMVNKVAISVRAQQERAGEWQRERLALRHRPHGVMAVFGPFNFPGHLPNGHIVPALLAGNSVVFKPSELAPASAALSAELWRRAGLPAGVLNLVQGGRDVGEALVAAPVQGILFTGSHATGSAIHRALAGRPELLLALEMGGNNPLIVTDVDSVPYAASTILHSAFLSAGQRCTCTRRLIVVDKPANQHLLSALVELASRVILNTPEVRAEGIAPFMGPLIHSPAARRLFATEAALLARGAKSLLPLRSDPSHEVYAYPGIIDVTECRAREDAELFGPLLQVIRVPDFDAALTEANASRFGLAAGLLSDHPLEQQRFLDSIRAGVVSLNLPTAGASSELPFGGIGASGNQRPSAYYAADYCAWPLAISQGANTAALAATAELNAIRGLR